METKRGAIDSKFAANEETKSNHIADFEITIEDITALAMAFYGGGYDSISSLLSLVAYELALNPDCQKKLQAEIDNTFNACKGPPTYEALLKMKYLDMVISGDLIN